VVRARRRLAVHAAGRAGARVEADRDDRGAAAPLRHREAQRATLDGPRRDARRLLGPHPHRPPGEQPPRLRADACPPPRRLHVDYSPRIQTVHRETTPLYYALIERFEALTGCPVLVNTSFNVRGEPIICTPEDAWRCFMRTEMDYLVIGSFVLDKTKQPPRVDDGSWKTQYELD